MEYVKPQTKLHAREEVDFLPQLERGGQLSLEKQLVRTIRESVLNGRLRPGMRLPSSRKLATELHVNRNTVVNALEQLIAEGYLIGRSGSGTFVSEHIDPPSEASMSLIPSLNMHEFAQLPQPAIVPIHREVIEFRVCQPSTTAFPLVQWRKAWRQVTRHLPSSQYSDPIGEQGLRVAVAEYLAYARGLQCGANDLIITSGAVQAFSLAVQALLKPGMTVAFEEPGYPLARQVFERHAAHLLLVPVDKDGLCVEALPEGAESPTLVYVTPSHQFPLGVRMSSARRMALLEWAVRNNAIILEDDYDSEFRYDAPPLPPLASLDSTGRVIYVGTFSKALSPSLRVGYMLAPLLRERLMTLKCWMDYHTSTPTQLAIEYFMREGYFAQHISRMRRLYAEKRALLMHTLLPLQSVATVWGMEAGLHAFVAFEAQVKIEKLLQTLLQQGVLMTDVSRYYAAAPGLQGLVLGYGGLNLQEIELAGNQLVSTVLAGDY